jgi:hypothetical protein
MEALRDGDAERFRELLHSIPQVDLHASRLASVRKAMAAVPCAEDIGPNTAVTEMLTNLMHLCDEEGLDFEERLRKARMHHDAETEHLARELGEAGR